MKRWVAYLLAGAMVTSSTTAWAGNYKDVGGHWAENAIATWTERNVLNGYNEMFRPDDTITKGEMAVILDRMMYYTEKQQNTFTDLDQAFYTDPILKAAKAGILLQSNALIQPKQTMTKQEAIVMFAKALGISPIEGNTDFEDDAQIADWAKGYVAAMKQYGYITSDDGVFHPDELISRAEVATLLSTSVGDVVTESKTEVSSNGKNVIINTPDVTLQNTVIDKDLILSEGVGEGDITLENVTVKGALIVKGGGIHTVTLKNCNINNVSVQKKSAPVRILTQGGSVANTTVTTSCILEGDFDTVHVSSPTDVTTRGNVQTMVLSAKTNLNAEGTIQNVTVLQNAQNTIIKGAGVVKNVTVEAENVNVETANTNVVVAKNISQTNTSNGTIKGGGSGSSGSSSSGGGSNSGGSGNTDDSFEDDQPQQTVGIKSVECVTNGFVRVTLNKGTEFALSKSDFSIICTGGGSSMRILNVTTKDNKVYDLTTTYYKDSVYNLQVKIDGKYYDKDFVVRSDCPELTGASVKRVSDTTADFSYDSDAVGTLYYTVVRQGAPVLAAYESITEQQDTELYTRNISPLSNEPTEEYLLTKGKKANMSIGMNKVKLSGLNKNTPYTLYYMGVDTDTKMTPVKQIDISGKPAVVPKPPKPAAYNITEVIAHFNPNGNMTTGMYYFVVKFDKEVEEELTLSNFNLTCPALSDLNTYKVEKQDNTTYIVYNNSGLKGNNTLTMTVTFADGSKSQKQFDFGVMPPVISKETVSRISEDKINFEFRSDKAGTIYYKVYDKDDTSDYDFSSAEGKRPEALYKGGTSQVLKAGPNYIENINAVEGQIFAYATKAEDGTEDNTIFYKEVTGNVRPPIPEGQLKIVDVKVEYIGTKYIDQHVHVIFDQEIDYMGGDFGTSDSFTNRNIDFIAATDNVNGYYSDITQHADGSSYNEVPSTRLCFMARGGVGTLLKPGADYEIRIKFDNDGNTISRSFTVPAAPSPTNTIIMDDEVVDNGIMDDGMMDDDSMTNEDTMTPDEDGAIGGGSSGSGGNGGTVDSDIPNDSDVPSDDTNNTPDGDTNDTDVDNTETPDGDTNDTDTDSTETPDGDTSDTDTDSTDTPDGDKNDTDVDSTETPDGDTNDTDVDSTDTPDGDTNGTDTDNTDTPDGDKNDTDVDNTDTPDGDTNGTDTDSADTPDGDTNDSNTDNTNTPDGDTSDSNIDSTNTSNGDTNHSDTSSDTSSSDASNNSTPSISQSTKPNDSTGKDDSDGGDSGNGDSDSGIE